MATTSGETTYDLTQNQIIVDALEEIEAIAAGETPSAEDADKAGRAFEKMIKHWQGRGIHIWTKKEALLFLNAGRQTYPLGENQTTEAVDDEDVVQRSLAAAAAAAATSIVLDSAAQIADSDRIGILMDNLTFHWTTVSGAPVGDTVNLADAMPSAAAEGNDVFSYAANKRLKRPLRVMHCRRRNILSDIEVPIIIYSHQEYFDTPNKLIQGLTNTIYYDPRRDVGLMYVWPTGSDESELLSFTYAKPIENAGALTDNPDFPTEWLDCLTMNLAARLARPFGVAMDRRLELKAEAAQLLQDMEMWDTEPEPVIVQPDMTYGGWTGV